MPHIGKDLVRFILHEAREAANAGYWDMSAGNVERHVERSILTFVSRLIYADEAVDAAELGLLRQILRGSPDLPQGATELHDLVERTADEPDRPGRTETGPHLTPAYIRAIIARDLATGSRRAAMVVDALFHLGITVIAADGRETESEIRTLIAHTHALRSALMRAGLDPDPSDYADDAELQSAPVPAGARSLEAITNRLDALAAHDRLKQDVLALANLIRVRRIRAERGLPVLPMSFHIVCTGGSDAGRSAVAGLIAEMYRELGVVSRGHLVAADPALLAAGHGPRLVGHLEDAAADARGGVLLINPVPAPLTHTPAAGPARDVADALTRAIDCHGKDFALMIAAPAHDMRAFLEANPAIRARINIQITLDPPTLADTPTPTRTL